MKRHDEIEIKLKITNRRELKQRLKALRFTPVGFRVRERNVLYDFPDGSLTKARCVLRLRSAGGCHWMTFKGTPRRSGKYKVREEIETAVADAQQLSGILHALSLRTVFVYEKRRTTYTTGPKPARGKPPSLVVDETAVGDYVELEGPRRWINQVASQLGFDDGDYITASYVSLLLAADQRARRNRRSAARPRARVLVSLPPAPVRRKNA